MSKTRKSDLCATRRSIKRTIQKVKQKAHTINVHYISSLRTEFEFFTQKSTLTRYTNLDYQAVVNRSILFLEKTRIGKSSGRYGYVPGGSALLYSSCYAALIMSLLGILDDLPTTERNGWIDEILSYQEEDGFFVDPQLDCPAARELEWWGWKHLTLHALMALAVLGGEPKKFPDYISGFRKKNAISNWLSSLAWDKEPANASNAVQNVGTYLQFSIYYGKNSWVKDIQDELFCWLEKNQDIQSGSWGKFNESKVSQSQCVQTGYHIWLLYFWAGRFLNYSNEIIYSCLRTQNRLGGFGVEMNSSACEDIDTIDPLSRMLNTTNQPTNQKIKDALLTSIPWLLYQQNEDGGWVFKRKVSYQYGHSLMNQEYDSSTLFPTWFRLLSLAYIAKAIPDHPIASIRWNLKKIPGHQFWQK